MTLLIFYVALALAVSFICSILESVLLSTTPSHIAVLERDGHPQAERLRRYKDDIDRPLAAILSLNTVAHTIGAAGAGAQAAQVFGSGAVGLFSAILTLLILFGTEIIPKTLGALHWKRLLPPALRVLAVLIVLMWPLVAMSRWLTRLLTPGSRKSTVSRDELEALAEAGEKEGIVAEGESRVLRNLLRLSRIRVRDIMTPIEHVQSLPADAPVDDVAATARTLRFSRIPLRADEGRTPAFERYVMKDDLLEAAVTADAPGGIAELARELAFVQDDTTLPGLFDLMVERREHLALARAADGTPTGIVTMEDVIETLLGLEIYDEVDDETQLQERARAHWIERAQRLGRITSHGSERAALGITGAAADDAAAPPRRGRRRQPASRG